MRIKVPPVSSAIFSDVIRTDGMAVPAPISTMTNRVAGLSSERIHASQFAYCELLRSGRQLASPNLSIFRRASSLHCFHGGKEPMDQKLSSSTVMSIPAASQISLVQFCAHYS